MGAPDVEDYILKIYNPENPDEQLEKSVVWLGILQTPPADYDSSGEPVVVSSAFEAFPGANNTEQYDNYRAFLFDIFSGRQPDARDSWDNLKTAAGAAGANQSVFEQAFFNHVGIALGLPHDPDGDGDLGDLETLYQALGGSAVLGSRSSFKNTVIENAIDYFLRNYDFTIPDTAGGTFADGGYDPNFDWNVELLTQFAMFFGARATADEDVYSVSTTDDTAELLMYEKIFNEFVVQPPVKPFDEVLAEFYNEAIERDGYFVPSHHLKDWLTTVQEQQRIQGGTATSVQGTNSQKTAILLTLFRLLVEVIEVLQRVAAAQGQRLQFYAGYQRAYTELLKEIPIINEQDVIDALGNDKTSNRQSVMSFTQSQNQAFTEKVRSFRSIVGDEAKQHQTTVNQSNEIVTQQANLGTSILQQLSTILTNMFK